MNETLGVELHEHISRRLAHCLDQGVWDCLGDSFFAVPMFYLLAPFRSGEAPGLFYYQVFCGLPELNC